MSHKTPSIQSITITLLLLIGFSSGTLALPDPVISKPKQTTRFYVWASTGPLSYLTDARITIRDAKGQLVALGKTNHRGIVGFRVRNKKLRELPLNIVTSGGKVDGIRFRSQLKARAHEVGGKNPIIYLDLVSTTARQITGPRMNYAEATSAVRNTLKINKRAAVDTLRVKNPYVDGDRLKHAVLLAGGHTRFVRELGGLAKLGQTMNGLEPPQPTIKTHGQPVAARILEAALNPEQSSQKLEPVATTQSSSSTLCTTPTGGNGNTVANYGSIATASLLEVVGLPLAATEGVTGMLLSSVGLNDSSPTTEALDEIAEELDCISSQLQYIEEELAEIETLVDYDTLQTELTNANNCQNGLALGWSYYNTLANQGDGSINASNPNLCVSNGGACGSGDIYGWQAEVNACGAVINNTLFGTGGDAGGSAWAQLNILYQSEYAWYTQAQTQAMQSFLSYWSTMLYYQFVLQNEVFNFYGQWANAVTFSGGPGTNGSTACAYNQPIPNVNVCQWQSNIQYAYPSDLYSDEIGLWNGTAINAFPGGIALGGTTTSLNDSWLAKNYGYGGDSFSNPYYASTVTANAMTDFNNRGINPAGNPSAIETWDSPQALRTLTLTSSDVSSLSSPQTLASGALTASEFLFGAVNQIPNTWPTSDGLSSSSIGYYTSDNVSIISGNTYYFNGVPYTWYVQVANNSTIPSGTPTTNFTCEVAYCDQTSGNETILAALMGRTWWSGASNATDQSFYQLLPQPLTVPNAPTLTALKPSTGQIEVSFDPVPASQDGGMSITGYMASCTAAGSTTPIAASGTASPITVAGLTGGVNYNCTIQAENAGGLSAIPALCPIASCSATPTASTTPSAPVDLVATAGYLQISLAFNPPSDTGGQSVTGYQANCSSSTTGATSGQVSGTQSPLLVTGLTGGVDYSCTVVAQNSNGSGSAASAQATTLAPTAPGSPTITSSYYSYLSSSDPTTVVIGIFYDPPANNGGSLITSYALTCLSTNATPSITLTGVAPGTSTAIGASGLAGSYGYTYSCTVTATNQDGLTSSPSSVTTVAPP